MKNAHNFQFHNTIMGYPLNIFENGLQVGTGTGISPMVGFLQARAEALRQGTKLAPCHVYFGCRDSSEVRGEALPSARDDGFKALGDTRLDLKTRLRNALLTRSTIGVHQHVFNQPSHF